MYRIEPFQRADLPSIVAFVEAIQEFERIDVPELKPGTEIGASYAQALLRSVAQQDGVILLAKDGKQAVGFVCAWIDQDDDPLLREDARRHAYVSDIFVGEAWRRRGLARTLLLAIEAEMGRRGCRRIRVCAKAANLAAVNCYRAAGYRPYEITYAKRIG
jgi:ribosomal protein S18 acetylase RimI-like enzyme